MLQKRFIRLPNGKLEVEIQRDSYTVVRRAPREDEIKLFPQGPTDVSAVIVEEDKAPDIKDELAKIEKRKTAHGRTAAPEVKPE